MSWPEALVSAAERLAWPLGGSLLLIAMLVVFRRQLGALLGGQTLTRVKAGPFEAEWTESVAKVEAATATNTQDRRSHASQSDAGAAANAHAVLRAYDLVVDRLAGLLADSGAEDIDPEAGATALAEWANESGLIEKESVAAVEGISVLRDLVTISPERVTSAQAAEYETLVTAVLYTISNARLTLRGAEQVVVDENEDREPGWLARLRPAAKQRPRTQFVRIRWHDLQELLRERDVLWRAAPHATRSTVEASRREYGRDRN